MKTEVSNISLGVDIDDCNKKEKQQKTTVDWILII